MLFCSCVHILSTQQNNCVLKSITIVTWDFLPLIENYLTLRLTARIDEIRLITSNQNSTIGQIEL